MLSDGIIHGDKKGFLGQDSLSGNNTLNRLGIQGGLEISQLFVAVPCISFINFPMA